MGQYGRLALGGNHFAILLSQEQPFCAETVLT
jgi:hypothetical protein